MSDIPGDLKYTKTHEWLKILDDKTLVVGITAHAQDLLGDMVFVELPELDTSYNAGDDCAVVESVKAASDIYSPVSGEVIEINEALTDAPEIINKAPYEDGWIFKMRAEDFDEVENLLNANEYEEFCASEEH
ncbi:MAG: glycine cleavage system protein GcvH [Gammaproteobacteria bacterium]|nr:glycine cleavage system protein GcvH [Gammaproteobacteria bacterium]